MGRRNQWCISCDFQQCERLYGRKVVSSGHSWDRTRKVKQPYVGIGWICPRCGAMFTDEQVQKCRVKLWGSEKYDDEFKPIKQKFKPIEGLNDLVDEIQNPSHYFG